jgi:hypothetical protein
MWAIWCLQKDTQKPASEIVGVREWIQDEFGFDGWWEALQFDRAVSWFGRYMESALMEIDDKGNHVHSLRELLEDDDERWKMTGDDIRQLQRTFGGR